MKNNAKILTLALLMSAPVFAAEVAKTSVGETRVVNGTDTANSSETPEASENGSEAKVDGRFTRTRNFVAAKATATNAAFKKVVNDAVNATWNNRPRATAAVLTVAALAIIYGVYKAVNAQEENEEVTF